MCRSENKHLLIKQVSSVGGTENIWDTFAPALSLRRERVTEHVSQTLGEVGLLPVAPKPVVLVLVPKSASRFMYLII